MVRLRVAIFLDQQSRNERVEKEVEELIKSCGSAARHLVGGLLTELPELKASSAEVCFLTLVLRHTGLMEDVRLAQRLLDDLPRSELVEAFHRRNMEVLQRLEALRYVASAAEHRPWRAQVSSRPTELRCLAGAADMAWLQPGCWQRMSENAMVQELREELETRHLWTPEAQLILSYSGGVDSTAHLLLLRALQEQAGCPQLRCLLLVYPNRQPWEVDAEKAWASWVCQELHVELFIYEIQLARPHGDTVAGLSREEYERFTKEIRFRMYRCLCEKSVSAVVLGHHQDDVDENRLSTAFGCQGGT